MMGTAVPPTDVEKDQPEFPKLPAGGAQVAHPMRGMFKKEMTELMPGFCVMAGIFVVLYVLMVFTYMPGDPEHRKGEYLESMFTTTVPVFIPVLAMCLCGLLTGGIQFFRESKIDPYAFLTHRPLTRTRIYLCRVISAHLVLILAAALPTLLFYAWASAQEVASERLLHNWLRFTLMGLFAASGSYFAGVLLVTRVTAKWYGTLMLPIFTGFLVGLAAGLRETKWAFLAISIPGLILMAVAGHGSFTTFGQLRSQKWYERFSLGTLLLPGMMYFILMLCAIVGVSAWKNTGSLEPEPVVPIVEKDGTPVLLYVGNYYYRAVHTLDDKQVRIFPDLDELPKPVLLRPTTGYTFWPEWNVFHTNTLFSSRTCMIDGQKYSINAPWQSQRYMEVYDETYGGKSRAGLIDAEGFKKGRPLTIVPMASTGIPLDGNKILIGNSLYELTQDGTLKKIFELPDGMPYTHMGVFNAGHGIKNVGDYQDMVVATEKHLYLIDYTALTIQNRFVIKKEWPCEPGNWEIAFFWLTMDDPVIRYDAKDKSHTLLVYTATGKRVTVPAPHEHIPPMAYWPWRKILLKSMFGLCGRSVDVMERYYINRDSWNWKEDSRILFQTPEAIVTNTSVLIASVLTASVMWWILARQHFGREKKVLWSFLAFVFGPAVLLLRLAIVPGRVILKCPDCQKKRPAELQECPHCHKPWPAPARDGREIFSV